MSTLLGTILSGRYRLEARIGSGGMSTVYRAVDETLQRQVAIKLLNREVASDSDELERFRREARAVAQLSHPHIVAVIDAGEDEGRPYIVFECVEGETLKERIRRRGRLPVPEAVAYAIEIARALGVAHSRHIVHRDVKPQNVLIDEEGSAKVTDFGIARTLDEEGLTADGRVIGTTDYVSPEQALGQPVTGEVTSVLRTLPSQAQRRVPFRVRHRVIAVLLLLVALAAVAGAVVYVGTRAHHGVGALSEKPPASARHLHQVVPCGSCAQGFNPLGSPTNETPNADLAIDDQLGTYWDTQQYYDHKLDKAGTGIYVNFGPGTRQGTTAADLRIIDATPGFTATIYARHDPPPQPPRWPDPGWIQISPSTTVGTNTVT